MKQYIVDFLRRGLLACGGGPMVLAIIYAAHSACGTIDTISLSEAAKGIITVTMLAFVAGGVTVVYQIERLALFPALLIHGAVLYLDYLVIYLINGWLASGMMPIVIFSICFILGYTAIWAFIYFASVKKTKKLNKAIKNEV